MELIYATDDNDTDENKYILRLSQCRLSASQLPIGIMVIMPMMMMKQMQLVAMMIMTALVHSGADDNDNES